MIKVGNTSLQVQVDVFVENMYLDGRERAIHGVFSFVASRRGQGLVPVLLARASGLRGWLDQRHQGPSRLRL